MENTEVLDKEEKTCECGNNCKCNEEHHECKCEKEDKKEKKDKSKKKIKELEEKVESLEDEKVKLNNEVLIAKAELINYRKRKDEETSNMLKYASQDLIEDLITCVDSFERALKIESPSEELSKFLEGFKMIYANMCEVLKRQGVSVIDRVGEEFDSNLEEALMTEEDPTKKDDEVVEVLLKGYKLKDRVIRPSSVKINKL